jgi:hypothetical protein
MGVELEDDNAESVPRQGRRKAKGKRRTTPLNTW